MKSNDPPLRLVTFQTPLLHALNQGRAEFERASGFQTAPDWPNPEFAEAIPFFLKARAEDADSERWSFLVITGDKTTVVGELGSKGPISENGEIEVGYGIAPSHRRKGCAVMALKEFIRLAFQHEKISAVVAECLTTNLGSIGVLERCRFTRVGTKNSDEGELLLWRLKR